MAETKSYVKLKEKKLGLSTFKLLNGTLSNVAPVGFQNTKHSQIWLTAKF